MLEESLPFRPWPLALLVLWGMGCARTGGESEAARPAPAASPAATAPAVAYEPIAVERGGRIAVTVIHAGPSRQAAAEVMRDQETCGTTITTPIIEVGENGMLENAVVFIEGIQRGKAVDLGAAPRLDNRGCHFLPHVQTVTVGQTLEIVNSDPILHNSHAYAGNRTVFNFALPVQGQQVSKKITTPGLMNIKCDAGHTWMNAWIFAFPHPYHAVTGDQGQVVLTDVPPGSYQVTAWHEELGSQTAEVTVEPGGTVELTMNRLAKPAAQPDKASS